MPLGQVGLVHNDKRSISPSAGPGASLVYCKPSPVTSGIGRQWLLVRPTVTRVNHQSAASQRSATINRSQRTYCIMGSPQIPGRLAVLLLAVLFASARGTDTLCIKTYYSITQLPCSRVASLAGQAFDSILTLDMQIFGQTLTTFGPDSQSIITQGVANFLNSGVAASQIVLTVRDQIAGVSFLWHSLHILSTQICIKP